MEKEVKTVCEGKREKLKTHNFSLFMFKKIIPSFSDIFILPYSHLFKIKGLLKDIMIKDLVI